MSRASEFIELYNRLSDYLEEIANADRYTTFSQLVSQAASRNAAVRQYARKLLGYGDLRNAIVHDRIYPSRIIAEPNSEALADFAKIVAIITSPPCLIPTFQRQVKVYNPQDQLVEALKDMADGDFSQVVLMNDSHLSLLTTAGIARWLEKASNDVFILQEATIGEAHACELPGALLVMARNKTIFDVQEAFTQAPKSDQYSRLFAVVVTQNGRDTEKPLGIVTPWDVLNNG